MTPDELHGLVAQLRAHPSVRSKLAIAGTTRSLGLDAAGAGRPGDDAAMIPTDGGFDLFAGEGFIPAFVADDPWFAGWCGVMVNLSDIAAMGGRATALIDQIWAPGEAAAAPVLAGLKAAAEAYGVPLVGGHTNLAAKELSLAVSVLGKVKSPITSFDARPGDVLIAAVDQRGAYRNFDNFFAAADAPAERLRGDLALLPDLAEAGLVTAGKDISQGGLIGTALMLAECSGVGLAINLDAIEPPTGVLLARWLVSFPSFGFLLTAASKTAPQIVARFAARSIAAAPVGRVVEGSSVTLTAGGHETTFWDHAAEPYLGLRPKELCDA